MKIKEIRAVPVSFDTDAVTNVKERRPAWDGEVANPMSRYPRYKSLRRLWTPSWGALACVITAEDGT